MRTMREGGGGLVVVVEVGGRKDRQIMGLGAGSRPRRVSTQNNIAGRWAVINHAA